MKPTDLIQVCDQCLCASCWQGLFMCQKAQNAGTIHKTRAELLALHLENPEQLKTDEELANE